VSFIGRPPVLGGGLLGLGAALPALMFTIGSGWGGLMAVPKMGVSVVAIVTGSSILVTWLRGGQRFGLGGSAGGLAGRPARQYTARSPKRTAATATALTIGIALVSAFGVVGESLKAAQRDVAVMFCLFGAALGIGLGVVLAWAAVSAIPDTAVAKVAIPYESVLFTVLIAVLAGVLAAVIPARRASTLNVLDAIATTS